MMTQEEQETFACAYNARDWGTVADYIRKIESSSLALNVLVQAVTESANAMLPLFIDHPAHPFKDMDTSTLKNICTRLAVTPPSTLLFLHMLGNDDVYVDASVTNPRIAAIGAANALFKYVRAARDTALHDAFMDMLGARDLFSDEDKKPGFSAFTLAHECLIKGDDSTLRILTDLGHLHPADFQPWQIIHAVTSCRFSDSRAIAGDVVAFLAAHGVDFNKALNEEGLAPHNIEAFVDIITHEAPIEAATSLLQTIAACGKLTPAHITLAQDAAQARQQDILGALCRSCPDIARDHILPHAWQTQDEPLLLGIMTACTLSTADLAPLARQDRDDNVARPVSLSLLHALSAQENHARLARIATGMRPRFKMSGRI